MALFDGFKSYEHEINEIRQYLINEQGMNPQYAHPFIAAYGKQMAKLLESGRTKTANLNTSDPLGQNYNSEFAEHGVRFSVLGQAIRAYLSDLKSGHYINTPVEVAVWGIILNEDPNLVDSMKPGLAEFVSNYFKRKVPKANKVFVKEGTRECSQRETPHPQEINRTRAHQDDFSSKPATESKSQVPKGDNYDEQKMYMVLVEMFGRKKARGVLSWLSTSERVRRDMRLGNMAPGRELCISLGLKWLAYSVAEGGFTIGPFKALRNAIDNFSNGIAGVGGYVMTDQQVLDLVQDVLSYMNQGECYRSGPNGSYLNGLDRYIID